jgi:hypothetical protein
MNLLIIRPHSFVDLITNSSSELFILDTKQSVNAVKGVIEELVELYNKRVALTENARERLDTIIALDAVFSEIFQEPRVAEFTFDLQDYPGRQAFRDVINWHANQRHPLLEDADEKSRVWERLNPSPDYKDTVAYSAYCELWRKAEAETYKAWNLFKRDMYLKFYTWVAEQNGVDITPLGRLLDITPLGRLLPGISSWGKPVWENNPNEDKIDFPASRLFREVDEALSWEYSFKKGDIFLRSVDDNSIPYELFGDIEHVFSCERRHLG